MLFCCHVCAQEDASDPAQIILITLAVYYVEEVEEAFRGMKSNQPNAMKEYSEKQVDQLKELIRLTQTKLNKSDRTRVMVCITMDAHSRDIVINMIRDNVSPSLVSYCSMYERIIAHSLRSIRSTLSVCVGG